MNSIPAEEDRVLWILCARALQRAKQGFPSTDEEIEAYEAIYDAIPEEEARWPQLKQRILDAARRELDAGTHGAGLLGKTKPLLPSAGSPHNLSSGLAAAARKGDAEQMSPELTEEVKRIIDESDSDGNDDDHDDK
jgi:hypothetical protein